MAKIIIGVVVLLAAAGVAIAVSGTGPSTDAFIADCTARGAMWQAGEKRCVLGMVQDENNEEWCREAGGSYNACMPERCPAGLSCPAVCRAACSL